MPDEPTPLPEPPIGQWSCPHARPGVEMTGMRVPGLMVALCGVCCAEWAAVLAQATYQRMAHQAQKTGPQIIVPGTGALGGLAQFPRQN